MSELNSLKQKTITSMIMSFSGTIGTQFAQLIIEIVLARILLPKDFGILGMVAVFIVLSQVFIESGFNTGLIREKESTQEEYSTIFIFNLAMATVLYIILFASAGLISEYFREPSLVNILRVLSLVLFINAFGLIQRAMLTKNIDFKTLSAIDVISAVISGIVAIIAALSGLGVWSLVIKTLISQLIQTLLLVGSNRWKPTMVFSYSAFKRLFGFSWKILFASLLSRFYENIYYVIIGRNFTLGDLGFFSKAVALEEIAMNTITSTVQKVSYPVLSHIQDEEERLKNTYKKMIVSTAYINFPVMMGLSAVAPQLLVLILGEKWLPAVPYFQIMCFSGVLHPLHALNLNILQVKGRSDLYLYLSILKRISGLVLIGIVLYFKLGIIGLVWSSVVNSYISFIINSSYSKELISYSTFDQTKDFFGSFVAALLMFASTYFISNYIDLNILLLLLLQIVFGVIIYICLSIVLKLETFYEIINVAKLFLSGSIRRSK